MSSWVERLWYGRSVWRYGFYPLTLVFRGVVALRRCWYRLNDRAIYRPGVPVVIIGNISVGGTGKTPLTIAIVNHLKSEGFKPGVISRGYGGEAPHYPHQVAPDDNPERSGDEPLLIRNRADCPVVVDPVRPRALKYLVEHTDCDVVISDDGLQHLALKRDVEIVVIDGGRQLGNRMCLPAGPLREPPERLATVDWVISNGQATAESDFQMLLKPTRLRSLDKKQIREMTHFAGGRVHAVAGIGNPERFFVSLEGFGVEVVRHPFPDHHHFSAGDLRFNDNLPVIVTEKDAVKCADIAIPDCWYLEVEAELPEQFLEALSGRLKKLQVSSSAEP